MQETQKQNSIASYTLTYLRDPGSPSIPQMEVTKKLRDESLL